jgi:hypothetical protein
VDDVTARLTHLFQALWALSPDGALKQLERSALLPLLKAGVCGHSPAAGEDVGASLARERARLGTLLGSIAYLESVELLLQGFPDLKHAQGAVCSFRIAVQQIESIREKQLMRLGASLPVAFISRCQVFIDFLFSVQRRLDPALLGGFEKEIHMLKAVEYFDGAKALFDEECDICEKLYRVMWERQQRDGSSSSSSSSGGGGAEAGKKPPLVRLESKCVNEVDSRQ